MCDDDGGGVCVWVVNSAVVNERLDNPIVDGKMMC